MTNSIELFKKYRWYLKAGCAVALISILIYSIDLPAVVPLLAQVNFILIIIFSMYVVSLGLGTIRWRLFLPNLPFLQLFITAWIGNFFSNFLPSSIGGDSYRVLALRQQVGLGPITTAVFLDRIAGVVPIVLLGLPTLIWLAPSFIPPPVALIIVITITGFVFLLYRYIRRLTWFQSIRYRIVDALRGTHRPFVYASIISVGYLALGALSMWLYYFMFGYHLPLATVFGLYAVVQLIELLPISINSLGVREGALVVLFGLVGVPAEVSLGIAIVSRLVLLAQTAIGGLLYAIKTN